MLDRGLAPDFPREALRQLEGIDGPAREEGEAVRDLRGLLWCSIDNDDSRDLDQLTVSEKLPTGETRVRVAIADVDAVVRKGTPIDLHARQNTTSVYTGAAVFPMLPEKLSFDLTSLNEGEERLAVVTEYVVDGGGGLGASAIYRARVVNRAKLAYNAVAAWLSGEGPAPAPLEAVPGLAANLKEQDAAARRLKERRHEEGALDFETLEPRAVFADGNLTELKLDEKNRARDLIEDFMIAANGVSARYLRTKGMASLRRVVRSPERWPRIVELAAEYGDALPPEPDPKALAGFLARRRKADPVRFPDLSLVVVKLMGRGEYAVEYPGGAAAGHFGLAVLDYTHSTAPNRRYPDVVTQRLLKAALASRPSPYAWAELEELAAHCTEQENDADKVERQVRKSAAAMLLQNRIGEWFDGVVTGASAKGTWARIFRPPVEGKIVEGFGGLRVGDRVRVKLLATDVERGYIDFVRKNRHAA
ncbi:MAG TPA: RNB domain-containing ribonuclease [Thermoanaerobaculia bacterium]|nr:RNB domain-containing ribonuclease [Thermoanaerobaculia bacterium]HQR67735.1 RNB domain-containing ribonuclease [Thermoanaerobaculia bacterium]